MKILTIINKIARKTGRNVVVYHEDYNKAPSADKV